MSHSPIATRQARTGWRRFAWTWATLLWILLVAAAEGRPRLGQLGVAVGAEEIAVTVRLHSSFDEEFLERLDSGLPTELTYRFGLYRDRKRWFDGELAKSTYQVIAMYNGVSREYLVNYKHDGRLTETRVVRDLAELERAMSELEQVPIFSLGTLRPKVQRTAERANLLVRARVVLGSGTWLFVFPTTKSTDSVRSRKFRLDEGT